MGLISASAGRAVGKRRPFIQEHSRGLQKAGEGKKETREWGRARKGGRGRKDGDRVRRRKEGHKKLCKRAKKRRQLAVIHTDHARYFIINILCS